MPRLQEAEKSNLKNNLLPFPALMAAPKDPPRLTAWQVLVSLVMIAICLGLVTLTLWSLFM